VKTDWEFEKLRDTEDLRLFDISEFVSGSPSTELLTEAYLDSAYKEIRRRAFWPLLLFSIAAAFPILCFIALNRSEFEKSPLTFSLPFWSAIVFSLVCVGIGRRLSLQDHTIIMSEIRGNFRSASLFERAEIAYKHLRSNKAPVYLRYQNGTIVKLGSKVWNLGVVPLYLFGDERVRRAIQPDSAQPCARVYFDERDLNSIVLPSGQKEVKEDSFCAHVKALLGNEKILRRYAENYLNWRDPEHKDYKGEIDPKDIRYHNVIIHFYENRDVLTNWYQKKKSDDERITKRDSATRSSGVSSRRF